MAEQKKKILDKWKKKKWFEVIAPASFDHKVIGETVAEKPEMLAGRTVQKSVRELTRQAKKGHITVLFKIESVQGSNAQTKVLGLEVKPSLLKRVVRRRTSKIEAVQNIETKDGLKARVKTVAVTTRKASKQQETSIRQRVMQEMKELAAKKSFEQLLQEIVFGEAIIALTNTAKKVYPIKKIEVLKLSLL